MTTTISRHEFRFLVRVLIFSIVLSTPGGLLAQSAKANIQAGQVVVIQATGVIASVHQNVFGSDGKVVIRGGTTVSLNARKYSPGSVCEPGEITYLGGTTTTVDGQNVHLTGRYVHKGESNVGLCAGLTVGLFFVIGPFSFFCLAIKGEEVKEETILLQFVVNNATTAGAGMPGSKKTSDQDKKKQSKLHFPIFNPNLNNKEAEEEEVPYQEIAPDIFSK